MQAQDPIGSQPPNAYLRGVAALVEAVARRPRLALLVCAALTLMAGAYAAATVRMNSDDSTLISQHEPFRRDYEDLADSFPQFDEASLIVITAASLDLADEAVDRLRAALEQRDDLVETIYAPTSEPFFEDHGFLYLEEADLHDVIERLAEAQPALTALVEDPSLRGLFDEFELSIDELEEEGELPVGFTRMAERVSDTIESMLSGRPRKIGWADEFLGVEGDVYRVILVQGRQYFDERISSTRLIDGIRGLVDELGLTPENGVRVRLTGFVPLAHEEQEILQKGLALAGTIATLLLATILAFGVRSLRIIVATFVTLVASLTWTTAWAMLAVGEFNIISAAFGVLLTGLGVDFAIHFGLRYEEETRRGLPVPEALRCAALGVGGAVSLCALTSAIAFFSFVPTRYYGLAALGTIAGGGILMALLASFTVFPAMLATMRAPSRQYVHNSPFLARLYPRLARNASGVVLIGTLLAAGAVALSFRMTFDFSTLGMKDPESESMTTLRELQAEDMYTDYSATVLAESPEAAEAIAVRLAALPVVSEVRPPSWYLPQEQEEKLAALEDAAFFLEPVLFPEPPKPAPDDGERRASVEALQRRIEDLPPGPEDDPVWRATRRLGAALQALLARPDADAAIEQLEGLVVADLVDRIDWLRRAVSVQEVGFDDLPESLREQVVAPDGTTRLVALPREDLSRVEALIRFVDSVATVAPRATGRPAVEAGIGEIVVDTFRTAIGISLVLVSLILVLALRSVLDALVVLLPITLAAFFTVAIGVLIDMPFNMANVVAIPLVLGLGVDNGIHVFMRFRHDGSLAEMMESSTPRAVVLSTLTTLAAFGSLAASHHRGIHSMGVLLSVAMLCLIACTLVVLPALIVVLQRIEQARRTRQQTA